MESMLEWIEHLVFDKEITDSEFGMDESSFLEWVVYK